MKLKKIELAVIAITIAFACFTGGFFAGRRDVRVISVEPESRLTVTSSLSEPEELPAAKSDTLTQPQETEAVTPSDNITNDNMVNINIATREELTSLPGIGDTLAGRIIEFREAYGGFAGISELMLVSGIGEKKFEALKDYVCVD